MWIVVRDREYYPWVERFASKAEAYEAYIDAASTFQEVPEVTVFMAEVDCIKAGRDYQRDREIELGWNG